MDFLPYVKHHVTAEDVAAVARVLASDRLTQGREVQAFEQDLAQVIGVGTVDAVACSSGTAALHLAMLAMNVKPGDRVVTSPLTFCATANAILMCDGRPVFADVDSATLNIRPECAEEQIVCHDPKPVGILAVHYAGRPCDMKALREIANKHHVWLVEDACHALGARYQSETPGPGIPVGLCYANLSCWSFHPAKHVAAGEGGAVTGPLEFGPILTLLHRLRDHGRDRNGLMQNLGYNYRMDEMSAALARSQLKRLPENICRLYKLADSYAYNMPDQVRAPAWSPGLSAWHLYRISVPNGQRDALREHLADMGIGTQLHYRPVYLHPYYNQQGWGMKGLCPNAEEAWEEGLSLPMFASMQEQDVKRVCEAIEGFYEKGA